MKNDENSTNDQRPAFPPSSLAGLVAAASHIPLAARRAERLAKAREFSVHEMAANATQAMLTAERKRRAVRRGKDVYLPSWEDSTVGLPNVLLRSSLWSAGVFPESEMENAPVAVLGPNADVDFTGPRLTQYDRCVFSACLDYYREDRPLSRGNDSNWIQISFFKMAQSMGLAYTLNTHTAIHGSLVRLAAAGLCMHKGQLEIPIPQLLEVVFFPDNDSRPKAAGRDKIMFRVLEQMAALYGVGTWTAVPKPALKMKGLRGWLTGFFATETAPRLLPFQVLYELSGLACRPNDFLARICTTLDELKTTETPKEMRVARYQVSPGRKSIIVSLVNWATASTAGEHQSCEINPEHRGRDLAHTAGCPGQHSAGI